MAEDRKVLGQRIRAARHGRLGRMPLEAFGRAVAEALGRPRPFSNVTVSNWETGRQEPSWGALVAIARLTALPLEYFAGVGALEAYPPADALTAAGESEGGELGILAEALRRTDRGRQHLVLGQATALAADLRAEGTPARAGRRSEA